jgi:large subunit ribosomal protein L13e
LSQAVGSTPEELANATQVQGDYMAIAYGEKRLVEVVKVTEKMKAFKAYGKIRVERMSKCQLGARPKKAAEAEKEEKK